MSHYDNSIKKNFDAYSLTQKSSIKSSRTVSQSRMPAIKYCRLTHVIGLLVAMLVNLVLLAFLLIYGGSIYYVLSWSALLIVYAVLWFVRRLATLVNWFPLFHYIGLVVELVSHCLMIVLLVVWASNRWFGLFDKFYAWLLLMSMALVLAYVLLVVLLAPVPYVLLAGSEAQKAELAREVCPCGPGPAQRQRPEPERVPVQIQVAAATPDDQQA